MTEPTLASTLYVKHECPFCLKVRIFLLEAGLLDSVTVQEFAVGSDQEHAIRSELAPHFEKVNFPTIYFATGEYLAESVSIIAHYAGIAGVDPANLPPS